MGKMYHVTNEGVTTSVPLSLYALALEYASKDNPNALLSLSQSTIILDSAGPAWIEVDGNPPIRVLPEDDIRCFFLDPEQTLIFRHDNHPESFQITVQPSGESSVQPIGTQDGPVQAPSSAPPYVQSIYNWLYDGQVGSSSLALAYHLGLKPFHLNVPSGASDLYLTPKDPYDWNRCFLLLSRVPELQQLMPKMAEVSEQWKDLVSSTDGDPVWLQRFKQWQPLEETPIPEDKKLHHVSFPK